MTERSVIKLALVKCDERSPGCARLRLRIAVRCSTARPPRKVGDPGGPYPGGTGEASVGRAIPTIASVNPAGPPSCPPPCPASDHDVRTLPDRPWHAVDHRENFPVASWLLPAASRPAVIAIYRFARHSDDIADEGEAPLAERLAALGGLDDALTAARDGATTGSAVIDALPPLMDRHRLDWQHLHDLLSAFRQDLTVTRYADPAAVQDYCERSANPVGRLMLELFDSASAENRRRSDCICSALQKINFCQDVAIDWPRGRLYLPLDTLARHGIDPGDLDDELGARRYSHALRQAIAEEAARARDQLLEGRPLIASVPWRLSLELRAIVSGGLRILDRIAAVDCDVREQRPVLGWRDALPLFVGAVAPRRGPARTAR